MTRLEDDVAKFLGLPPHNTPTNICLGDGYFAKDCERRHGKEKWRAAVKEASNR